MIRVKVRAIDLFERPVRLRLPFRFGAATLREARQAFVRAEVEVADHGLATGWAADLMVPKWFDKDPNLSHEANADQLRTSLAIARDLYQAAGPMSPFGLAMRTYDVQRTACAGAGLNGLTAAFGPATLDRAVLDAACRALGVSVYDAVRRNLVGMTAAPPIPDLDAFAFAPFLESLPEKPQTIALRHTVGLADAITRSSRDERLDDGLPETLEEVVAEHRPRYYKLKVSGDAEADVARLTRIAVVLDASGIAYRTTLDGNEQFEDADAFAGFLARLLAEPRLERLASSLLYVEQPLARAATFDSDVTDLGRRHPLLIDEADDALDSFPQALDLGYRGVSAKGCKGLYKALVNLARCAARNARGGAGDAFMSAEDLTAQAGPAVQQDTAIAALLGLGHVERNGHVYGGGLQGAGPDETAAFLQAHGDLYAPHGSGLKLRVADGELHIGSLHGPGFALGAKPDAAQMRVMG